MPTLAFLLLCILTPFAYSKDMRVEKESAPVFSDASESASSMGVLPKGKRVQIAEEKDGFARIVSRTGRKLWISKKFLGPVFVSTDYDIENDIETDPKKNPAFRRIRLDLGGSGGSLGGMSFLEGALGMEYFMMERLSWRNAAFYRFTQNNQDTFGLDSSMRGNENLPLGALGLRGILGAGYRFSTRSEGAPFAEVGGFAAVRGFDVGIMAKYLWNSIGDASRTNVVIYSVVLSGATGFF